MIHEHDALALASAAIDFGLTEDEADRLRRAVAECPICAERAGAYRRQVRLLAELPIIEPSDALRRRVMTAAVAGRAPRTGVSQLLLAAALVIGAMLALLAVVAGGAFNERPIAEFPPIDVAVSPSAPPIALGSARPGAAPSAPIVPEPTAELAHLPKDAIADVITNNLRLRSEPRIANDSIKLEPFLAVGDRLLVIAGPVNASNHDWYQVAAWRPSDPSATWPIGWVATADVGGDHWIAPGALSCPAAPTTADLAALRGPELVACYGNRTITVRALVSGGEPVDPCPGNPATACLTGPTWLAGSGGRVAAADVAAVRDAPGTPLLELARDPAGPVTDADLPSGRMIRLAGAFDHPAASSCSIEGAPTSISTLTVSDAILRCRSRFVISSAVPEPAFLTVQSAAITTTAGLRVRSLGLVDEALSQRYEPLLGDGTRLFVLDGPVLGSGYDWFRVIVPSVTRTDGQPMVGWIAVAGKDGEVWAKNVDLGCPPAGAPVALADLARLGTGASTDGGVACFGDATISTSAPLSLVCSGPDASATGTTNWLGLPARMTARLTSGSTVFEARVHPDLAGRTACDQPTAGDWVVAGHFSDIESEACGSGASSEGAAALAVYRCRTIFVVTSLTAKAP